MTVEIHYSEAKYLKSAPDLESLPPDEGIEVAFIGRSNAGKSSALNTITGIKNLARTSNTPGRTQMINLFDLGERCRFVDLPGYGYAKVPLVIKQRWEENINSYLQQRECLRALVLVMDIRHPLKELDQQLIHWCVECGVPIHILLTKADKLKSAAQRRTYKEVSESLAPLGESVTLQLFSAHDRTGVEEAKDYLTRLFSDITE